MNKHQFRSTLHFSPKSFSFEDIKNLELAHDRLRKYGNDGRNDQKEMGAAKLAGNITVTLFQKRFDTLRVHYFRNPKNQAHFKLVDGYSKAESNAENRERIKNSVERMKRLLAIAGFNVIG